MAFPLTLDSYELRDLIGRGATSHVYSAICRTNGIEVALKVVDLETSPMEIETLHSEVSFWSTCNHPNVLKYYGSFVDKSVLYIVMEYMNGGSCYEIMRYSFKMGLPNENLVATILREVVKSLVYFHSRHQIHRDVKVGNVLVNEAGDVKIADFGVAANLIEAGRRKRARFTVIGTPCYMSPEVLAGNTGYTEKTDIWALGITAIELATGTAPYANLYPLEVIVRISNSPPPTLPGGRFSAAFREFVKACLQKSPDKRASARELLDSKFLKQSVRVEELTKNLLVGLPPLHERFAMVHEAMKDTDANNGDVPASWEVDVGEWNFPPEKEVEEVAVEAEEKSPVVVKRGRFTVDICPKPLQRAKSYTAIDALRQRITALVMENADLRTQVGQLAKQVHFLVTHNHE